MTSAQVALTVIVLLLVVIAGFAAWYYMRRRSLREQFGPEYDRAVADQDSQLAAERELRARQRRHDELQLEPLDDEDRDQYAEEWRKVQEQFVEDPANAVVSGEHLLNRLIAERGYPRDNYDEQLAVLSVEHAHTVGHYRDAHGMYLKAQKGEANTEDLRQALVHYRAIFDDLLGGEALTRPSRMDGQRTRTSGQSARMDRKDVRTDEEIARREASSQR